jgi:hypothetical protein
MPYTNIKNAWRTRKQALSHILSELVAGRLGAVDGPKSDPWAKGCAYESRIDGKISHCGVGCLFNESQIRSIKMRGLNTSSIDVVEEVIGTLNLETVTGLHMEELMKIQDIHDGEWQLIQSNPLGTDLHYYLQYELKKA